jgi:hypothetical protein
MNMMINPGTSILSRIRLSQGIPVGRSYKCIFFSQGLRVAIAEITVIIALIDPNSYVSALVNTFASAVAA